MGTAMNAKAESTMANRRPPISRVIIAVKMTAAEVASAGTIRILRSESQQEPGDLDEERYHRRLIHIAPGQMVPTSQVIEFVAEVTILIVEIEVQQEVQEGENQDDGHAIRKKGLSCMVEHRCLISGDFHLGVSRYGGALNTLRSSDSFKAE